MAGQTKFVLQGGAVISRSDYMTAGGAGTFTDVGYTDGPVTIDISNEDFMLEPEQEFGAILKIPTGTKASLKFSMWEQQVDNMLMVLRLPGSAKSGTGDNLTLLVGASTEMYDQIKLVGKGPGTNKVRTWTIYKCGASGVSIMNSKKEPGKLEVTMDVLLDPSVATADKLFKQIDT